MCFRSTLLSRLPPNPLITSLIKDSIRDSNHAKSTKTDYSFLTNHLTLPPSDVSWSEQEDNELLEQIQAATVEEKDIYDPLCKLLTRYSKRIYSPYLHPVSLKLFLTLRSSRVTTNAFEETLQCLRVPGLSQPFSNTSPIQSPECS